MRQPLEWRSTNQSTSLIQPSRRGHRRWLLPPPLRPLPGEREVPAAEAMELASGSVYKAFKDKSAVFLAAFDREAMMRWKKLRQIISTAKSGRDRLHNALIFYAESSHGMEGKRGCLIVGTDAKV